MILFYQLDYLFNLISFLFCSKLTIRTLFFEANFVIIFVTIYLSFLLWPSFSDPNIRMSDNFDCLKIILQLFSTIKNAIAAFFDNPYYCYKFSNFDQIKMVDDLSFD